mgnify:CR=1 FL=1
MPTKRVRRYLAQQRKSLAAVQLTLSLLKLQVFAASRLTGGGIPAVVAFDIAALALHLTGRGDLRWLAASSYQ